MAEKVLRTILDEKIIAIIRNVNSKQIDRVVEALLDGHIRCMEFAFSGGKDYNEDEILYLINRIRDKYADEVIVGAGTVMTIDQVERACNMGAQYMISPNVNKEVISRGTVIDGSLLKNPNVVLQLGHIAMSIRKEDFQPKYISGKNDSTGTMLSSIEKRRKKIELLQEKEKHICKGKMQPKPEPEPEPDDPWGDWGW